MTPIELEMSNDVSQYAFPGHRDLVELREIVDDCLAGQRTVKERGKYLPPTKWQEKYPEKYREFLFRALFPSETKYSLDIYEGLFNIGDPHYPPCRENHRESRNLLQIGWLHGNKKAVKGVVLDGSCVN
ncbi:MAG: hypothetical protein IJH79_19470 [Lentisphaeria bacterium]|nr:hypothetical protein [Lentisphaeria bacterium]